MFASFSFQIQEKTQEKDKLKTIYSGFLGFFILLCAAVEKKPMILARRSTSIFCCRMVRGVGQFYSQFIKGYFSTNSFAVSL